MSRRSSSSSTTRTVGRLLRAPATCGSSSMTDGYADPSRPAGHAFHGYRPVRIARSTSIRTVTLVPAREAGEEQLVRRAGARRCVTTPRAGAGRPASSRTWAGVQSGWAPSTSAAAPATCGLAIEVPLIIAVAVSEAFDGRHDPRRRARRGRGRSRSWRTTRGCRSASVAPTVIASGVRGRRLLAGVRVVVAGRHGVGDALGDRAGHRGVERLAGGAADAHVGHGGLDGVRGHPVDARDDRRVRAAALAVEHPHADQLDVLGHAVRRRRRSCRPRACRGRCSRCAIASLSMKSQPLLGPAAELAVAGPDAGVQHVGGDARRRPVGVRLRQRQACAGRCGPGPRRRGAVWVPARSHDGVLLDVVDGRVGGQPARLGGGHRAWKPRTVAE